MAWHAMHVAYLVLSFFPLRGGMLLRAVGQERGICLLTSFGDGDVDVE